jgi:hypothetical protein
MDRQNSIMCTEMDEEVIMDDLKEGDSQASVSLASRQLVRSPVMRTRSLSDGGGTPAKLSPSPFSIQISKPLSKDDSDIKESTAPVTPRRSEFSNRGLSLQMPPREFPSPAQSSHVYVKPAPLSPKLDHSQIYASPTNILPRRSRGLDFSRAATSLHHSILAEQSSPDSSPTIGGRAMNIPGRRPGDYAGAEQSTTSLWSMMGNQERMNIPGSLGSIHPLGSDSSSSSGEDDLMDEDMEEAYISTPMVNKTITPIGAHTPQAVPWLAGGSPAVNSLLSFQQRQRPRKQPKKRLHRPLGLGFSPSIASNAGLSKSPPSNMPKEMPISHSRRESISWQANQLHISGSEGEDNARNIEGPDGIFATPGRDGQRNVIRRPVTRRGSLLVRKPSSSFFLPV